MTKLENQNFLDKDELKLFRKLNRENYKVIKIENDKFSYWRAWYFTIQTSSDNIVKICSKTTENVKNSLVVRVKTFKEAQDSIYNVLKKQAFKKLIDLCKEYKINYSDYEHYIEFYNENDTYDDFEHYYLSDFTDAIENIKDNSKKKIKSLSEILK